MAETERRRRRPAVSCVLCRKRKVRCNRELPCSNCVRAKNGACRYESHPPLLQHAAEPTRGSGPTIADPAATTADASATLAGTASSLASTFSSGQESSFDIESLKEKIKQLEQQISRASTLSAPSPTPSLLSRAETICLGTNGVFHINESSVGGQSYPPARSVTHKTRLYGQSHWVHTAAMFKGVTEKLLPYSLDASARGNRGLQRCKDLSKTIKAHRTPSWPCPPTTDLPRKDIADKLVDCYMRTVEKLNRILHIPTFMKEYDQLWAPEPNTDTAFIVLVKLVFALGAVTYDDTFSLRASAMRWVYEAQTWISDPEFKSRLGLQYLQTHLLLILARELIAANGDSTWISTGALLRTAMYMGLHRDPAKLPGGTVFSTEMRRRLWNTIIELALQSSITLGTPPLFDASDFDTFPPGNFDDEQLLSDDPIAQPETEYTETSVVIALRKSFYKRLAIVKYLNDLNSHGTYEHTMHLDSELRVAFKDLRKSLHCFAATSKLNISNFETDAVEYLMHRYFVVLHVPILSFAIHETKYAFSRKAALESALRIRYMGTPTTKYPLPMTGQSEGSLGLDKSVDLIRLIHCGAGTFRFITMQASLLLAAEIRAQSQEEEDLGFMPLRPDLVSVLEEVKVWSLRCIQAGETNMKGHMFSCMVAAQIDGIRQDLGEEEMRDLIVSEVEHSIETCIPILEKHAALGTSEGNADGVLQAGPAAMMGDWDFMMLDTPFDFGEVDMVSLGMNNASTQGLSLW